MSWDEVDVYYDTICADVMRIGEEMMKITTKEREVHYYATRITKWIIVLLIEEKDLEDKNSPTTPLDI